MTKRSSIRSALARGQAYALLARAFGRPDSDFQSEVRDGTFRQSLEEAFQVLRCPEPARAAMTLDGDASGESLTPAFQRLFSPSVDGNCPPYETEYTGAHVFMRQQQLADVAGFYRAFGLRVAPAFRERPDHVAAELEFMAVLALKEAQALARGQRGNAATCRRARARFLREHLGRWLAAYTQRLSPIAGGGFYAGLVALARDFVAWDAAQAGVQPDIAALRAMAPPGAPLACPTPGGERYAPS